MKTTGSERSGTLDVKFRIDDVFINQSGNRMMFLSYDEAVELAELLVDIKAKRKQAIDIKIAELNKMR